MYCTKIEMLKKSRIKMKEDERNKLARALITKTEKKKIECDKIFNQLLCLFFSLLC